MKLIDITSNVTRKINLLGSSGGLRYFDVSKDGSKLVFIDLPLEESGDVLKIANLDGTGERIIARASKVLETLNISGSDYSITNSITSPRISPDGTRILFIFTPLTCSTDKLEHFEYCMAFAEKRGGTLWMVNSDGSNLRQMLIGSHNGIISPRWSPNGDFIMFLERRGEGIFGEGFEYGISLLNLKDDKVFWLTRVDGTPWIGWFPDGKKVAWRVPGKGIEIIGFPDSLEEAKSDVTSGYRMLRYAVQPGDKAVYAITTGSTDGSSITGVTFPLEGRTTVEVGKIGAFRLTHDIAAKSLGIDGTEFTSAFVDIFHNNGTKVDYASYSTLHQIVLYLVRGNYLSIDSLAFHPQVFAPTKDTDLYLKYLRELVNSSEGQQLKLNVTEMAGNEILIEHEEYGSHYSYLIDLRTGISKQISFRGSLSAGNPEVRNLEVQLKLISLDLKSFPGLKANDLVPELQTEGTFPLTPVFAFVTAVTAIVAVLAFRHTRRHKSS